MGDEPSRHRDTDGSSHRDKHRHRRDDDRDRRHRKKKRRRDDNDDDVRERGSRHRRDDDRKEESPEKSLADELANDFDEDMWEEKPKEEWIVENKAEERESWLTGETSNNSGSADPFSSLLGAVPTKEKKQPAEKPKPEEVMMNHPRQLNTALRESKPEIRVEDADDGRYRPPTWTIGDAGSSWRMMKLKNLYAAAKESMRAVEEVAIERLGSLQAFDEAREEEMELERRKRDRRGDGVMKVKVTGELYAQRLAKEKKQSRKEEAKTSKEIPRAQSIPVAATEPLVTQTDLNKLQAAILRAEMMSSPGVEKLRQKYSALVDRFNTQPSQPDIIQLPSSHSQLVAHLSREHSLSSTEMTIEDMVKEERAAKRSSNVERIIRDKTYRNDLDYLDENAEKLAVVTKRKEVDLKNMTIQEYQKQQRIMEKCPLCFKEDGSGKGPLAPVISLGTRTYLSLPTEPELTKDGSMVVPLRHARNLADCDDDEWEEIRNFMKCLIQMHSTRNQSVLFYEDASHPNLHRHPALIAIPMAHNPFTQAPAYFTQALNTAESEWATHRPIIRTDAPELGKWGFRKRIAKEAPYFHVWFSLEGGMGHVVEDQERWGNGELWVRSILGGGLLGIERGVWGRMGRWTGYDERVEGFRKKWDRFDWTKALAVEEGS